MDYSTVFNVLLVLLICALTSGTQAQHICTEGDVKGEGCRSYQLCHGDEWVQIDCHYEDDAYDFDTQQCVRREEATPPCNAVTDCTGLVDNSYPDVRYDCQWFYTCVNEIDFGHQTCAEGLVFQFSSQICNWPWNVGPPCGTCDTCEP